MRNKFGEPKSGCSLLIGCASMFAIMMIIGVIIAWTAMSPYMNEIYARSAGSQEELAAFLQSLMEKVNNNIAALNSTSLNILTNAAQIVILFIVFKLIYKRPVSQMGLNPRGWYKLLGMGCLLGAAAISLFAAAAFLSGAAVFSQPGSLRVNPVDIIISALFFISVGFYEEILCRGFFMTVLKTTRNKRLIVILPAVIFGLMHLLNPNVTLLAIVNIMLIGAAFAYMFIKTGSLWMPVGYHIMWNFIQGSVYGIQVSGLESPSLMQYKAAGPAILTGGAFGAEGGLICTAVTLAALVFIHIAVKTPEPAAWTFSGDLPFDTRRSADIR